MGTVSGPSGGDSGPSPFSTYIPPRSLTPRNSWGSYQLLIWVSGGEGWSPGLAGCAWAFGTYEQPLFNSGVSHQSTSLPRMHPLHPPTLQFPSPRQEAPSSNAAVYCIAPRLGFKEKGPGRVQGGSDPPHTHTLDVTCTLAFQDTR